LKDFIVITKHKVLIATSNPGKFKELKEMLDEQINWVSLKDFPDIVPVEEDGLTFEENARKKALGYAKQTGLWTIADDSGLVIDALGGAPGVKSARFSGYLPRRHEDTKEERKEIDKRNYEKVLQLLKDMPKERKAARFLCCLCLASSEKILIETQGTLEGLIIDKPIGENGFGYDPIFFVPQLNKTVAQLDSEQKNLISHRGRAVEKFKLLFEKLLSSD
jgi:XTP/dITP diphosphohydrolase